MNLYKKYIKYDNNYSLENVKTLAEVVKGMPELSKFLEQDDEQKKIKAQLELFKSEGVA
ncbi:MAG: hypothetical protein ACE364_00520 [Chlorobiota bacterium]